jgi:2-amino-4-hydroxy-6-hydroxymethyldihydropteridine diphosphokinase
MGGLHQACLLLGSNIEPERNIPRAVELLGEQTSISQVSSVWESASAECCYPDYLNMAVQVSTPLDPGLLKEQVLRPLEARMGRVRTEDKNASRPIDFDIILFDGTLVDATLLQFAFRAMPVSEIYPDFHSETGEPLKVIAKRLAQVNPVQIRKDVTISIPENG